MATPDHDSPSFVDTNVLVYAVDSLSDNRPQVARDLVQRLMDEDNLVTSTQVLQELYVTVTKRLRTPMSSSAALGYIDKLSAWPVITQDFAGVRDAVELSIADSFSLWDALIVIAASRAGAKRLYSEDLQHGRRVRGVEIINPFLA